MLNGTPPLSSLIRPQSRLVADDKPPYFNDETEASTQSKHHWFLPGALIWSLLLSWWIPTFTLNRSKAKAPVSKRPLFMLPSVWMVLTDTIQLSMWWVGMLLASVHMTWGQYNRQFGPKLQFLRHPKFRKPPDPCHPKPKWEHFLHEYNEMNSLLRTKRSFISRLFNLPVSPQRKRCMLMALNAASILARQQPKYCCLNNERCATSFDHTRNTASS